MRPKKRVAVLDENETARDRRCMLLDVWGYAACAAATAEELVRLLDAEGIDAVIAVLPRKEQHAVLRLAQELGAGVMTLDAVANAAGCVANVSLASTASAAEIREWLRILTCRKRGPKKADAMSEERLRLAEMAKVG